MAERPHRAKERWRRIGLLLVSTVLLGALFSRAAAAEDAFRYERFVADFSRPSEDWALEGHWAIRSGQLVHTLQPGSLYPIADARLRGRVWQNPTIELEFSVEEYGEYGLVRVMFGWQDRWNGYGVAFSEGGNRTLPLRWELGLGRAPRLVPLQGTGRGPLPGTHRGRRLPFPSLRRR